MKRPSLRSTARVALVTSAMCALSLVRIPTPVPVTLQTFSVLFALFFLGRKGGLAATLLYLALGLLGLPIFSAGGGLSALLSPTGGYVAGLLLLALVYLFAADAPSPRRALLVGAAALFSCLTVGGVCFALYTAAPPSAAVLVTLPFLPLEAAKLFFAHLFARKLKQLTN